MFIFLLLINNSVVIGLSFLLLSTSAITSSETINVLRFYLGCILQCFYKYHIYLTIQLKLSNFRILKYFKSVLSRLLIKKIYILLCMDLYHINKFYQYLVDALLE